MDKTTPETGIPFSNFAIGLYFVLAVGGIGAGIAVTILGYLYAGIAVWIVALVEMLTGLWMRKASYVEFTDSGFSFWSLPPLVRVRRKWDEIHTVSFPGAHIFIFLLNQNNMSISTRWAKEEYREALKRRFQPYT